MVNKPKAVIVDIDGTIANHMTHDQHRSHYDLSKVDKDLPFEDVIDIIRLLSEVKGYRVILLTGRSEYSSALTEKWLENHFDIEVDELFMRPDDDHRPDFEIKKEIYIAHIEPIYDVKYVFEDRTRVVKMWRSLGLRTFQVADGDF